MRAVPTYSGFAGVASLPGGPDRRVPQNTQAASSATINRDGAGRRPLTKTATYATSPMSRRPATTSPTCSGASCRPGPRADGRDATTRRQLFDPVFVLGYPITEAYWATAIIDGKPTAGAGAALPAPRADLCAQLPARLAGADGQRGPALLRLALRRGRCPRRAPVRRAGAPPPPARRRLCAASRATAWSARAAGHAQGHQLLAAHRALRRDLGRLGRPRRSQPNWRRRTNWA